MREILFRGKKMSDGKWVYGDYHKFTCTTSSTIPTPTHYIMGTGASSKAQIWVDSATVGQYTGLTDKNGVKIFEGDILTTTNPNCRIWFVDYKPTAFCANQTNANYSCVLDEFFVSSNVEVIGNIHDNPELLK